MNRHETQGRPGVTGALMALSGGSAWQVVSPTVAEASHMLSGVAAASPTEVWVVGHVQQRPLVALWDGTRWTTPSGPPPVASHIGAGFRGIAVAAHDTRTATTPAPPTGQADGTGNGRQEADAPGAQAASASAGRAGAEAGAAVQAIAVGGGYDRLAGTDVPLIHHWNGSMWDAWEGWTDPEAGRGFLLTGVTMAGEEAWAVGHGLLRGRPPGPVALHWHGEAWHTTETPPVTKGRLLAVSAAAAGDVWAVGAADRTGLVLHYDGRSWTRIPTPTTRFPLTDVVAVAQDDAWAVGRDRVLRWNGRKWRKVDAPVTAANTVTALSPDDVWVAGGRGELAHFDGHRWSRAASPQPLGDSAVWLASTSLPVSGAGSAWLVGSHQVPQAGTVDTASSITAQSGDS
ncbi:WD40/YVTN/BNR-like repeat-containing protein [Spirillospora sp. CA-255316]